MKLKQVKQFVIPITIIAFIASLIWTYISINSKPIDNKVKEVSIEVIPEYKITSGKSLLIWPEGTVFKQGMASYFYSAQPTVNITPIIKITGMEQGIINGNIKSRITIGAYDDKSQEYWSYQISETASTSFYLNESKISSEIAVDNIPVNVMAAYDQILKIGNELMFQTGKLNLIVKSDINISGVINGNKIEKSLVQELPFTFQQSYFTVPKPNDIKSQITLIESNTKSPQKSIIEVVRGNLLAISIDIMLFVALLFFIISNNKNKSKTLIDHKRFKEWITEGNVDIKDMLKINILSLEGLVDLAIDLDKRVIFDNRFRKYYVLTEDIVYVYDSEQTMLQDNRQQLGKLLIDKALLKPEQLEVGLFYQKQIGSRLGESLIALGFIDETTLYSTLAAQQNTDYYELKPSKDITDISWVKTMSIQKAKALVALPLGKRFDGKLVIACSDPSREGIKKTLKDMFGLDIYLVFARPSAILEVLEHLTIQGNLRSKKQNQTDDNYIMPYERLTQEERDKFIASYYRGNVMNNLLLKASGTVDIALLNQVPAQEYNLSWLVHKNLINAEYAALINGLEKVVEAMDFESRHQKLIPSLLDILLNANFITSETMEWINREQVLQSVSIEQLLDDNFIASEDTIKQAKYIIKLLDNILNKSVLE